MEEAVDHLKKGQLKDRTSNPALEKELDGLGKTIFDKTIWQLITDMLPEI